MLVLIQHLPRDSAFHRSVQGDDADWTLTDHLLALVIDHLAIGNWLFICANTEGDPPERPDPFPRPGIAEEDFHRGSSPEQIAAFFGLP